MTGAIRDTRAMLCDRPFLAQAVRIALPVAMQGMLNTVVNLIDTIMIGVLGATAIAAVGLANKVFFVLTLLVFGIVSGSGVLAAQFWGNRDVENVKKVLGLALTMAVGGALLFAVPSILFPEKVMRIFTTGEETIRIGARYLMIAAISYPFTAASNTFVALMRAVGQVKAPVAISCLTICVNVFLNYTLIFGAFGAPAMGVAGAALATLIARMVETSALLAVIYLGKSPIASRGGELFGYSADFVRRFFATAAPVIANEFMWGLGVTMYSLVYGRMGDNPVAAITVATTVQDILAVLFQGVGTAAAVILGHEMGGGNLKKAEVYARHFLILQLLLSAAIMAVCVAIRPAVIRLYRLDGEVAESVALCLLVFAFYLPVKNFNYTNIVGILRSGGDTKVCLFLDTSGVWLIGIPMAVLGGFVLRQPIHIVYAMVLTEEIYKMVLGYVRYRQKKWLKNLAVEFQ